MVRPKQRVSPFGAATRRAHEMLDWHEGQRGPDVAAMFDLSPEHIDASVTNFPMSVTRNLPNDCVIG